MSELRSNNIDQSSRAQVKKLLALAQDKARPCGFLPAEIGCHAQFVQLLTTLCEDASSSGEALVSTVCARETSLAVLQAVKELSKTLMAKAASEAERAAATLFYHACVAAALARYDQNISTRAAGPKVGLYEDLAAFLHADPLGDVFREAAEKLSAEGAESGNSKPAA